MDKVHNHGTEILSIRYSAVWGIHSVVMSARTNLFQILVLNGFYLRRFYIHNLGLDYLFGRNTFERFAAMLTEASFMLYNLVRLIRTLQCAPFVSRLSSSFLATLRVKAFGASDCLEFRRFL